MRRRIGPRGGGDVFPMPGGAWFVGSRDRGAPCGSNYAELDRGDVGAEQLAVGKMMRVSDALETDRLQDLTPTASFPDHRVLPRLVSDNRCMLHLALDMCEKYSVGLVVDLDSPIVCTKWATRSNRVHCLVGSSCHAVCRVSSLAFIPLCGGCMGGPAALV